MAKIKYGAPHEPKAARPAVSTSWMFKKAKKPTSPQSKRRKAKPAPFQLQGKDGLRKQKPRAASNPLLGVFDEAIENSRENIDSSSVEFIETFVKEVNDRMTKGNEGLNRQINADMTASEAFAGPIGDTEIQYTKQDGTNVGSASLSDRMKRYRKTIEAEEKTLQSLLSEYAQVSREIIEDAEETLGADWKSIMQKLSTGENQSAFENGPDETTLKLKEAQDYYLDSIDKAGQRSLDQLKASEEDLKVRRAKQRTRLLACLDDF